MSDQTNEPPQPVTADKVQGAKVLGVSQDSVLTGQVVATHNGCVMHRSTAHDAEGSPEMRWCPNCGRNDAGERKAPGNGGWGT